MLPDMVTAFHKFSGIAVNNWPLDNGCRIFYMGQRDVTPYYDELRINAL